MATLINNTTTWAAGSAAPTHQINLYTKWFAFTESQAKSKTAWYILSMIAQGVLFLPIPAVLLYYFNAPIFVLVITLGLFFANIIAGMGGAGIRALISLFAASIIIHLIMLMIFIL
jgi:hypothetical protein